MGVKGLAKLLNKLGIAGISSIEEHLTPNSVTYDDNGKIINSPYEKLHNINTLIIDANGFAMFLAEKLFSEGQCRSDIGMSYEVYDHFVQASIQQLLYYNPNMKLEFVFDGTKSKCKAWTREQRSADRDNERNAILSAAAGLKQYEPFLPPILTIHQFKCTVQEFVSDGNVSIVTCEYEADQEIARRVAACNLQCLPGKENAFAYANDTDFIVMKDCPYIKFGCLVIPHPYDMPSDELPGAVVPPKELYALKVWRRSETAKALQLSEHAFVEFCLLVGNDFTAVGKRSDFAPLPVTLSQALQLPTGISSIDTNLVYSIEEDEKEDEEEEGEEKEGNDTPVDADEPSEAPKHLSKSLNVMSMNVALKLLKLCIASYNTLTKQAALLSSTANAAAVTSFQVQAVEANPTLQLHINYSRAFYDLRDLSEFPEDTYTSHSSVEEEDEECFTSLLSLSRSEKKHLYAWMLQEDLRTGRGEHVGNDVYRYLVHAVRQHSMFQGGKSNSSVCIQQKHLEAFRLMRELYTEQRDELGRIIYTEEGEPVYKVNGYGQLDIGNKTKDLRWEDVHAGWFIEYLYGKFMNHNSEVPDYLKKETFVYSYPTTYTCFPAFYYNGWLFHSICKQLDLENQAKGKPAGADLEIFDDFAQNGLKNRTPSKTATSVGPQSPSRPLSDGTERLPIDLHKDAILTAIARDRVSIIHGETGCGKSSRLPCMLVTAADELKQPCKMFVCQPRRIAASALFRRVKLTMGERVGLRMGNGVRDGPDDAVIIYATTGYLTRLLAYHPEAFQNHTHLVIDEVHERSVDSDLLCMLARRLLVKNTHIKLILMSATIHTGLYKKYFEEFGAQHGQYFGEMECLSVGVRRFPIQLRYLDDIMTANDVPPMARKVAHSLEKIMPKSKPNTENDILPDIIISQRNLAVTLVTTLAQKGTGVLIFVSGISDITEILERFEGADHIFCIGIHSDIAEEEQIRAFDPTPADKIKVVVATNAAESSLTIPDCDMVICLGTHKAMHYQAATHRIFLLNTWISQASATQRAGRTGRVRPGVVYRLYTKKFHDLLDPHETCEVLRTPLQDVILNLRAMLQDAADFNGVVPVLQDLLEAPPVSNIDKSFQVLYANSMITSADDYGRLTKLGYLAGQLPVDLELGRMVALGVALGVGAEACIIAAALSLPKAVFRSVSRFHHHNPDRLHDITSHVLVGNLNLDMGLYSDPLAMLVLYIQFKSKLFNVSRGMMYTGNNQNNENHMWSWLEAHGLVKTRVLHFISSADNLIDRMNKALRSYGVSTGGIRGAGSGKPSNSDELEIDNLQPSNTKSIVSAEHLLVKNIQSIRENAECKNPALSEAVINRLRLMLVWSGDSNLLKSTTSTTSRKGAGNGKLIPSFEITNPDMTAAHFRNLFPSSVPFTLEDKVMVSYQAKFSNEWITAASVLSTTQHLVQTAYQHQGVAAWTLFRNLTISNDTDLDSKRHQKSKNHITQDMDAEDEGVTNIVLAIRQDIATKSFMHTLNINAKNAIIDAAEKILTWSMDCPVANMIFNSNSNQNNPKAAQDKGSKLNPMSSVLCPHLEDALARLEKYQEAMAAKAAAQATANTPSENQQSSHHLDPSEISIEPAIFNIYVVNGPSKGVIRFFKQEFAHSFYSKSLSLNVLANGHGIIRAHNMMLSTPELESSFFAPADVTDLSAEERKIHQRIHPGATKTLHFPSNSHTNAKTTLAASLSHAVRSTTSPANKTTSDNGRVVKPLIDDLPLGMRILMAIQSKYKGTDPIRVWKEPINIAAANKGVPFHKKIYPWPSTKSDQNKAAGSGHTDVPIVGSQAWADQKDRDNTTSNSNGQPSQHTDAGWDPRMEALKMDFHLPKSIAGGRFLWQNIRAFSIYPDIGSTPKQVNAILQKDTVCGVALHNGPESMFGVSNGAMTALGDFKMIVCLGVTILPPGARWISLALLARGLDPDDIETLHGKSHYDIFQHYDGDDREAVAHYADSVPGEEEEIMCRYICQQVQQVLDGVFSIERREELISLIDELFQFWTFGNVPVDLMQRHITRRRQKALEESQYNSNSYNPNGIDANPRSRPNSYPGITTNRGATKDIYQDEMPLIVKQMLTAATERNMLSQKEEKSVGLNQKKQKKKAAAPEEKKAAKQERKEQRKQTQKKSKQEIKATKEALKSSSANSTGAGVATEAVVQKAIKGKKQMQQPSRSNVNIALIAQAVDDEAEMEALLRFAQIDLNDSAANNAESDGCKASDDASISSADAAEAIARAEGDSSYHSDSNDFSGDDDDDDDILDTDQHKVYATGGGIDDDDSDNDSMEGGNELVDCYVLDVGEMKPRR